MDSPVTHNAITDQQESAGVGMPTGLAVRQPVKWIRLPVYAASARVDWQGRSWSTDPRARHQITTIDPHRQRFIEIFELQ
jgi:hypothetical protein